MIIASHTDIGMKRKVNQDYHITKKYSKKTSLCVVCDGMGGAKGGEQASKLAAKAFVNYMDHFLEEYIGNKDKQVTAPEIKKALLYALDLANDEVYRYSRSHLGMKGMGTTIVATLIIDKTIFALNVGDSRVYCLKGNKIKQITKDHSYVQYLIDIGQITEEEAQSSANKNIITRAVGTERKVEGDVYKETITEGTFVLLCTDGLTNYVDNEAMCDIVSNDYNARNIDEIGLNVRVKRLIDSANDGGGSDNITAVLVKV
ncbi:MAG: Stp1/IreP family PP2C-type Ser/Thr phosphatase [Clostridia bacterium]|nr:Stp1/IreP family PP2C-type Ser/Thr phosphatase [Clostridia bacterium]MBO5440104.1 Stp1/IreP family PP2C-type Ser/Thr phosphatase [Clostridia bacterium]